MRNIKETVNNGCLFLYINLSEVTIMTTVKCNKHKCYYNIEGICSHRKINLRYFKCLNYTRDDKRTFKVQDLIDVKLTCHREHRRYKDNSNKVYK